MKICGIIVEYNPLHNGHVYHITKTKEKSQCNVLIAVMSGNFVQRGEPAILDKYTRTKHALLSGVDLVIELPYRYAVQSADYFAYGAISLLHQLGVDEVYFGSESGNLSLIKTIARTQDTPAYNERLLHYIDKGFSYPNSSMRALNDVLKAPLPELKANDTLGIQYVRAISKINASIEPFAINRIQSDYHDSSLSKTSITSATSIRKAIKDNHNVNQYVPDYVHNDLLTKNNIDWDVLFPYLKYKLISSSPEALEELHDIKEGIQNRMIEQILTAPTFSDFTNRLISKRYTRSKIRRMLTHVFTNFTKQSQDDVMKPTHAKVLGFTKAGANHLKNIKTNSTLTIISNTTRENYALQQFDLKSEKLYHYLSKEEMTTKPIII